MVPLPDQPLNCWRTNQIISTIFHLQRDEQLSSSDDWGQMDLAILDGLLNGITAGSIQVQSKIKRTNLMPNRKRWDSGRRTPSIQLRQCIDKTSHTTSTSSFILPNLTLKKSGKLQS